jgi:hypothetical protein
MVKLFCCGASAETDTVRGLGIVDPRHGEQMSTVLATNRFHDLQFCVYHRAMTTVPIERVVLSQG